MEPAHATIAAPRVTIVEVGPRDGLQNEETLLSTEQKVAYIQRLIAAGVRRLEATSFVHPRLVPQMADAEEVMARVPRDAGVSYIGLVLNERGFDRALAAGVDEINVVIVASETFSQRNQGMSVQEGLASFSTIRDRAGREGLPITATIGASFGCPFEGEVPVQFLRDIVARCAEFARDMLASPSTASRLSRLSANCAAMSPSCWGLPSPLIAVCPEQYRVRVCPETISPWLNPISTDHVTGLRRARLSAGGCPSARR
jgi:hypothetical protein